MTMIAAVLFCLLLASLACFQAALIVGAPLGHLAWGGQDRVLPRNKRVGSVLSIALYAVFALIALQRANLATVLPLGDAASGVAMWVLVGYFALGVVMNGLSRSAAERWTMAPLSLLLAVLSFMIAAD